MPGSALSSSPKRDSAFSGSVMQLPDSPRNSMERNIKPSDILRQKSSESLESSSGTGAVSVSKINRKTTPEMNKLMSNTEFLEELGHKLNKTESLEKTKRPETSGSGGYSQSPTNSLNRSATSSGGSTSTNRSQISQQLAGGSMHLTGASPTSSLNKSLKLPAADSSSTGSLDKKTRSSLQPGDINEGNSVQGRNVGSKESLSSQGIVGLLK